MNCIYVVFDAPKLVYSTVKGCIIIIEKREVKRTKCPKLALKGLKSNQFIECNGIYFSGRSNVE